MEYLFPDYNCFARDDKHPANGLLQKEKSFRNGSFAASRLPKGHIDSRFALLLGHKAAIPISVAALLAGATGGAVYLPLREVIEVPKKLLML